MKNIILIGMPGSGKTSVGKKLAIDLGKSFFDSDAVFEERKNIKISDFFERFGENLFRDEETKILTELCEKKDAIISTGGGIVERNENKDILKQSGIVVFINRPLELIAKDIDSSNRPLLKDGKKKLFELYERRAKKYKDFCDIEIENTADLDSVAQKIINEVTIQNG
ncbi:MAG: shikimate kinase [Clostridia bacterium]|nr:shikimate kinase [Clostridia bacterium]